MDSRSQIPSNSQPARIRALADKIRPILNSEDQAVVMSALALVCGEALGSIHIAPPYTRMVSLQLFCQQVADIAAKVEDQRR